MALYLGEQKIASGGGSKVEISAATIPSGVAIANISVDNVPYTLFAPPQQSLTNYVDLTTSQPISGKKTFTCLSAATGINDASLDGKTLIMSDANTSYNVNYSAVKSDIMSEVNERIEEYTSQNTNEQVASECLDYAAAIFFKPYTSISCDTIPYDSRLILRTESKLSIDNVAIDNYMANPGMTSSYMCFDIPAGVSLNITKGSNYNGYIIPYRYGSKLTDLADEQITSVSSLFDNGVPVNGIQPISAMYVSSRNAIMPLTSNPNTAYISSRDTCSKITNWSSSLKISYSSVNDKGEFAGHIAAVVAAYVVKNQSDKSKQIVLLNSIDTIRKLSKTNSQYKLYYKITLDQSTIIPATVQANRALYTFVIPAGAYAIINIGYVTNPSPDSIPEITPNTANELFGNIKIATTPFVLS